MKDAILAFVSQVIENPVNKNFRLTITESDYPSLTFGGVYLRPDQV